MLFMYVHRFVYSMIYANYVCAYNMIRTMQFKKTYVCGLGELPIVCHLCTSHVNIS